MMIVKWHTQTCGCVLGPLSLHPTTLTSPGWVEVPMNRSLSLTVCENQALAVRTVGACFGISAAYTPICWLCCVPSVVNVCVIMCLCALVVACMCV